MTLTFEPTLRRPRRANHGDIPLWQTTSLKLQAAGATVIAAASTPEKLRACAESGADFLLNYRRTNDEGRKGKRAGDSWRDELKRLVGGRGVDVVLDSVGGADCEVCCFPFCFRFFFWQDNLSKILFLSKRRFSVVTISFRKRWPTFK